MNELEFNKYRKRGIGYHWEQVSLHPIKRRAFVIGRYNNLILLLKSYSNKNIKDQKILDVGCGDGVLAYQICKQGAKVFGIDSSEIAISYAKQKTMGSGIEFLHGSAYELPWDDEKFDAVVSSDVIEHVQDVDRFLSEIRRVVRKVGHVVISTPIRFTEKPLDNMHVVEWFPDEFKNIILRDFPDSLFFETHPVFWMEMTRCSIFLMIAVNIMSLIKNPFETLDSKFCYKGLQFSVSKKKGK